VDLAGGDRDDLAGAGDDLLQAHAERHRALDDLEALLLLGVDMGAGHGAVGGELQLDLEQLAVGVGGGLDEGDLLAADGVLDRLSCVGHLGSPEGGLGEGYCDGKDATGGRTVRRRPG
jgi:hypothetical protein